MPHWWKNFSWEWLFDHIAARSPTFVKIMVVTGKSFLYYHGMTRAASLTYTTLVAVVPLLIMLTSITLAVGFGNFISDYLPIVIDMLNLDWPTEQIMDIVENAEHIPIKKLGFIVPIRIWLADENYNADVRRLFNSDIAEKFFNVSEINAIYDEYVGGNSDNWRKIWTIYTFLVWYEEYFVKR